MQAKITHHLMRTSLLMGIETRRGDNRKHNPHQAADFSRYLLAIEIFSILTG